MREILSEREGGEPRVYPLLKTAARFACRARAGCKVGLDRPLISTALVANMFRSARVFRPRRAADRRSHGWIGYPRDSPRKASSSRLSSSPALLEAMPVLVSQKTFLVPRCMVSREAACRVEKLNAAIPFRKPRHTFPNMDDVEALIFRTCTHGFGAEPRLWFS